MLKQVNVRITINFTKIIATLTLLLGFSLSVIIKGSEPFLAAVGVVMVIVGARDVSENIVKSKNCKENDRANFETTG